MSSNDKILRAALLSHLLDTLDRLSRASERAKKSDSIAACYYRPGISYLYSNFYLCGVWRHLPYPCMERSKGSFGVMARHLSTLEP